MLSNRGHLNGVERSELDALPMCAGLEVERLGGLPSRASLLRRNIKNASRPLSRELLAREAVLLTFCDPLPEECSRLLSLSAKQWRDMLYWLDISGLALYFLD